MPPLKPVPCPRCGITLHEVPQSWGVWTLALPSREATTGQGALKLCYGFTCHKKTWVEFIEGPQVTLRMTSGWVKA